MVLEGLENVPRWMVASAADMIQGGGCPFQITDARFSPPNRETASRYLEMFFQGPSETIAESRTSPTIYTLPVQIICTVVRDETNLYWIEQLQGWAFKLLQNCFTVKSHPLIEIQGDVLHPIAKTGNGSILGQADIESNKIVDTIGPFPNLNRTTITAVYKWEYTWNESSTLVL